MINSLYRISLSSRIPNRNIIILKHLLKNMNDAHSNYRFFSGKCSNSATVHTSYKPTTKNEFTRKQKQSPINMFPFIPEHPHIIESEGQCKFHHNLKQRMKNERQLDAIRPYKCRCNESYYFQDFMIWVSKRDTESIDTKRYPPFMTNFKSRRAEIAIVSVLKSLDLLFLANNGGIDPSSRKILLRDLKYNLNRFSDKNNIHLSRLGEVNKSVLTAELNEVINRLLLYFNLSLTDFNKYHEEYQLVLQSFLTCITILQKENESYKPTDIENWIKSLFSLSVAEASSFVESHPNPPSIIIYNLLTRKPESRKDVVIQYFSYKSYAQCFDGKQMLTATLQLIESSHKWAEECLPGIVRVFMANCPKSLRTQMVYNKISWKLGGYNRVDGERSELTQKMILEIQLQLLSKMKQNYRNGDKNSPHISPINEQWEKIYKNDEQIPLNEEGLLSIANLFLESHPDRARFMIDLIKKKNEERKPLGKSLTSTTPRRRKYLAISMRLAELEMKLCESDNALMSYFQTLMNNNLLYNHPRTQSQLWSALINRLSTLGLLTKTRADKIIGMIKDLLNKTTDGNQLKLPAFAISKLIKYRYDTDGAFLKDLLRLKKRNTSVVEEQIIISQLSTLPKINQIENARELYTYIENPSLGMTSALLISEVNVHKGGNLQEVWKLYKNDIIGKQKIPDERCLIGLLLGATKSLQIDDPCIWEGLYGTQRAVVQFKTWVIGAPQNDDSNYSIDPNNEQNLFKISPSGKLWHFYIRLLGLSGYDSELFEILPWWDRIGFKPDLKCLSALLHFYPEGMGKELQNHGEKYLDNWPSKADLNSYRMMGMRDK